MELQNVNNFNVVGEVLDQSSMVSLVELEAIAQSSLRRAFASKVIWMSKQFEEIESVAEIDRWGKTMSHLCHSMMQAGQVSTDEFNAVKCLKGANVTRDGGDADVLVSLKNTNDLEKSESVHVDVSDAQFESDREQSNRSELSGSEDEVDEVSALSTDGVSKGADVTTDGVEADVLVSLKNTNDLEKSESGHVDVSDAQFESDREQSKRLELSGSEDEVDEVSALSSLSTDGVSKDAEFVNCSSSSECLVDDDQERPFAEDKTSSTPPAIDFHKLSLFASRKPKVHVVPSLPSPFWVKKGGKVGRWRRNSFSAVQDSVVQSKQGKETGVLTGYYSADESCATKVAAN